MTQRVAQDDKFSDPRTTQIVVFRIVNEEFAIHIDKVREIIEMGPVIRMPKAAYFVEGVINLRNHIIPIIDLHKRFHLQKREDTPLTSVMIIDGEDGNKIGFIVDEVKEVVGIPQSNIGETPGLLSSGIDTAFLSGVGKIGDRLIVLLDIEKVIKVTNETVTKSST